MISNTAIGELRTEVCFYQIQLWYQEAINASGALPDSEMKRTFPMDPQERPC